MTRTICTTVKLRAPDDLRMSSRSNAGLRMTGLVATSMAYAMAALAQGPESDPATSLRDRYTALTEQLEQSSIQPGLYVESAESSRSSRGDVYAVVDYPFATVRNASDARADDD